MSYGSVLNKLNPPSPALCTSVYYNIQFILCPVTLGNSIDLVILYTVILVFEKYEF